MKHLCVFVNENLCFLWISHCCLPLLFRVYKWQTHFNWNKSPWEIRLSFVSVGKGAENGHLRELTDYVCSTLSFTGSRNVPLNWWAVLRWSFLATEQVQDKFSSKRLKNMGIPPLRDTWIQPGKRRIALERASWLVVTVVRQRYWRLFHSRLPDTSLTFSADKWFISNIPLHSGPELHVAVI